MEDLKHINTMINDLWKLIKASINEVRTFEEEIELNDKILALDEKYKHPLMRELLIAYNNYLCEKDRQKRRNEKV